MPVLCFICDVTLYGEKTQLCSSITPHSFVTYPEKIVELMGEEFVAIVTPADYICMKCTSLLIHADKLESDLKFSNHVWLSLAQKRDGMLPADQPENSSSTGGSNASTEIKKDPSNIEVYKCKFCGFLSINTGEFRDHMHCHKKRKIMKNQKN